jgi:hypothetical protein
MAWNLHKKIVRKIGADMRARTVILSVIFSALFLGASIHAGEEPSQPHPRYQTAEEIIGLRHPVWRAQRAWNQNAHSPVGPLGDHFHPETTPYDFQDYQQRQGIHRLHSQGGPIVDYFRDLDGYAIRIKNVELISSTTGKPHRFSVITAEQREGDLRKLGDIVPTGTSPDMSYGPNLISYLRQKQIEMYEGIPEAQAAIRAERDMLNGVSTLIAVTDENDLSKVWAIMRIVRRGNGESDQRLDLEVHNHFDLEAIEPEPIPDSPDFSWVGDWREIKSVMRDKQMREAGFDLMAIVWLASEERKYFDFAGRFILVNGQWRKLAASHFALETAPFRTGVYRELNFVERPENSTADNRIMTTDREGIRQAVAKMKERAGKNGEIYLSTAPETGWNTVAIPSFDLFFVANHPTKKSSLANFLPWSHFVIKDDQTIPFFRKFKPGYITSFSQLTEAEAKIWKTPQVRSGDFFRRLGIAYDATDAEVDAAYKRLRFKYSPGGTWGYPQAHDNIQEAYEVLRHPEARRALRMDYLAIYEMNTNNGFADQRFDPEPPMTYKERIKHILFTAYEHVSEIREAVSYAVIARKTDPEFDLPLAYFYKIPLDIWSEKRQEALHVWPNVDAADSQFQKLLGQALRAAHESFLELAPQTPEAIERLASHGRHDNQTARLAMSLATKYPQFNNQLLETAIHGGVWWDRSDKNLQEDAMLILRKNFENQTALSLIDFLTNHRSRHGLDTLDLEGARIEYKTYSPHHAAERLWPAFHNLMMEGPPCPEYLLRIRRAIF